METPSFFKRFITIVFLLLAVAAIAFCGYKYYCNNFCCMTNKSSMSTPKTTPNAMKKKPTTPAAKKPAAKSASKPAAKPAPKSNKK